MTEVAASLPGEGLVLALNSGSSSVKFALFDSSDGGAAALARTFKGDDPHGHRAELIRLIEAAAGVSLVSAARRDR